MESGMHYLAYGSNLHPLRLTERVPNARLVGTTELRGYKLAFHKLSVDGSAKCTLHCTTDSDDIAYAAIFFVPENEIAMLDAIEGVGKGYDKVNFSIKIDGAPVDVFTYIASNTHLAFDLRPYDWYKRLVLAGARYHDFPRPYIDVIASVPRRQDANTRRRMANECLLARIEG